MPPLHRRIPQDQTSRARQLRRQSTIPERLLWGRLRAGRAVGLKFRRQVSFRPYITDFYCPAASLVIELDGLSHVGHAPQDRQRSEYLEQQGCHALRYTNDQVIQDLDAVVEDIVRHVQQIIANAPPWK